jgi:hypothetical protein
MIWYVWEIASNLECGWSFGHKSHSERSSTEREAGARIKCVLNLFSRPSRSYQRVLRREGRNYKAILEGHPFSNGEHERWL